ncbi:MAG TPA: hypothetical protein VGD06_16370 [Acidobacteriota bacterium]
MVVDASFQPRIAAPAYAPGSGPIVLIDRAHHNGEALDGSAGAFERLLTADGYRLRHLETPIDPMSLAGVDLLVIANALPAATAEESDTLGSAFTDGEIVALLHWVHGGGGLLLFVDHRPFPRAAAPLGRALGLELLDGYALDYEVWDPLVFRRSDGTLAPHPIADGRGPAERVDSAATFFGHAMRPLVADIQPLFVIGAGIESMHPAGLWEIGDDTPRTDVEGWLQAATRVMGSGRVVVFGEAGMAVAQFVGPGAARRGMNTPEGAQNAQLLLNALHWLTGLLPES